jgi:ribosomal protein L37AE/L43A
MTAAPASTAVQFIEAARQHIAHESPSWREQLDRERYCPRCMQVETHVETPTGWKCQRCGEVKNGA